MKRTTFTNAQAELSSLGYELSYGPSCYMLRRAGDGWNFIPFPTLADALLYAHSR